MRYIGSKTWCLEKLHRLILRELPNAKSLCDPFAGTCTVARFFKEKGFQVTTGDRLSLSYAFQVAGVQLNTAPRFAKLHRHLGDPQAPARALDVVLSYLNQLPGRDGWVTRNFSLAGKAQRKFFTVKNARRLDAILSAIRKWFRTGLISKTERWYLLACVLDASDRVANTAGTYYAHLRNLYRKAHKPLTLRPFDVLDNGCRNVARRAEAAKSVRASAFDILYLDPPYNQRDYGAYYHLPELLVTQQTPKVTGRSGRPTQGAARSPFCSQATARDALHQVINSADARIIILHYAEYGLIPHREIVGMMKELGPTRCVTWESRPYTSTRHTSKDSRFRTRVYVCRPR